MGFVIAYVSIWMICVVLIDIYTKMARFSVGASFIILIIFLISRIEADVSRRRERSGFFFN